jgi:hypothetical protein
MRVQVLQRMVGAKWGKAPALVAIALSLGGCASGNGHHAVPVACKEGAGAVRAALARAPARVDLDGTPLSACFTRGSDGADLQQVGATYISAAAGLAAVARTRQESPEALRLGYLVGAAHRGAARTQGVHDELVRRIEQELGGVNTRSAAYTRGFSAGLGHG